MRLKPIKIKIKLSFMNPIKINKLRFDKKMPIEILIKSSIDVSSKET